MTKMRNSGAEDRVDRKGDEQSPLRFSVVTISFNQGPFLERAIRSVFDQDYPDVEYIIVDAGSTDGSRELIQGYRERIAHAIFEPDDGPADGLNKGFKLAGGEILGYLNADDEYLPGAFAKVAAVFKDNPQASVVYGDGFIRTENWDRRFYSDDFYLRGYAYGAVSVLQQSTFFRKCALDSTGGFNTLNRTCWDAELLLDLALHNEQFLHLKDFLSVFRIHGASVSGSGRLELQYQKDLERLFYKVFSRNANFSDSILRRIYWLRKWVCNWPALRSRLADKFMGRH